MTDIRTRLADALRDHLLGLHPRNHLTADGSHAYLCSPQLNFDILADVLLSLPGIAIVELPEPDSTGGITQEIWRVGNLTVETMGGSVLWPTGHKAGYEQFCDSEHSHNGCQPNWARKFAAALLAAANAAEADQ